MEHILARLSEQWLSLGIVGIVSVAGYIYVKWGIPRYYGKQLNSISWMKGHLILTIFLIHVLPACIAAPFLEEFLYRGPLLLLFDSVHDSYAWLGILFLAFLFGLGHRAHSINKNDIAAVFQAINQVEDGGCDEIDKVAKEPVENPTARSRIVRFLTAFVPGILYSYP